MSAIRLMVVEDESFTRSTLIAALNLHGIDVVADSGSVQTAVELAAALSPNAALIDLHLGAGPSGIDLAVHLRRLNPEIGIVMLTSYEDPRLLRGNLPDLPLGAQWLVKRTVTDVSIVAEAIRNSLDSMSLAVLPAAQNPIMQKLSAVQVETLRLVGGGFTNSEIAKKRYVSERSVEQTISLLIKKFNLNEQPALNERASLVKIFYKYANSK
jgi:DNA-binding NarL/FixJ family response regulator